MEYDLDDMPAALAARVRAATGKPDHLWIRHSEEWVVEAVTGDRATVMRLTVGQDGSVAETTSSFLLATIDDVEPGMDATVTIREPEHPITLPISFEFAQLLDRLR